MVCCNKCGKDNQKDLTYCVFCGNPLKQSVNEEIKKCVNCGNTINTFDLRCEYCGTEIYEEQQISAANQLSQKLNELEKQRNTYHYKNMVKYGKHNNINTIDKQKIELIKNFIIPNTKRDIFEFMLLATSNFDIEYYKEHLNEEDISDAWLVKIEQCNLKANLLLEGEDREKIKQIYNNIKPSIDEIKNLKKVEIEKEKTKQEVKKFNRSFKHIFLILLCVISIFFMLPALSNEETIPIIFSISGAVFSIIAILIGKRKIKVNTSIIPILIILTIVFLFLYIRFMN